VKKMHVQVSPPEKIWVGIDVSKALLEICCVELLLPPQVSNDRPGIKQLLRLLKPYRERLQVCCEASGGYERLLRRRLNEHHLAVSVLMPKRVRAFAEARGILAKTDQIDAEVLREYGRCLTPEPLAPGDRRLEALSEQLHLGLQVLEMAQSLENMRSQCQDRWSRREIQRLVLDLRCRLTKMQLQLEQAAAALPDLAQQVEVLSQTKGVGFLTALTLLVSVPELGTLSRNEAAALVGVAPYNRESGSSKKKRTTGGGRALARRALYLAALSASRFNPVLRVFSQRLLARGKLKKVVLVAVMRKLIGYLAQSLRRARITEPAASTA
jgi:transposase